MLRMGENIFMEKNEDGDSWRFSRKINVFGEFILLYRRTLVLIYTILIIILL